MTVVTLTSSSTGVSDGFQPGIFLVMRLLITVFSGYYRKRIL